MEEIKSMLHLDVMTVTGKTLGENLEDLKNNGYYEKCGRYLEKWNLKREDIIRPFDQAFGTDGSIAILHGNLAPEGAVVKHTVVPREMFQATLKARPFDCEEDAIHAVLTHEVKPGDAVIIRYEGPKGSGMPEMFYTTEAIASDPELGASIALSPMAASPAPPRARLSVTFRPRLPWAARLPDRGGRPYPDQHPRALAVYCGHRRQGDGAGRDRCRPGRAPSRLEAQG